MNVKTKMAKAVREGDEMLVKNTDISYLKAKVKSAERYADSESKVVRDVDGVHPETVISYSFSIYGKEYSRKLIVPDMDVVLVVNR